MNPFVLATSNLNKLKEFQDFFKNTSLKFAPQSEFGVSSAEETGFTFIENAIIKARHAAAQTGQAAIADDSGLAVDALNGAPGIYSARYAGENASDIENNQKLLQALANVKKEDRTAQYYCVLALLRHSKDPTPIIIQASWKGAILFKPQGNKGFGYDPLFYVPTHQCSAAELDLNIKNEISHRGQAMQLLLDALTK